MKKKIFLMLIVLYSAFGAFAIDYLSLRKESLNWKKGYYNKVALLSSDNENANLKINAFDAIDRLDLLLNFEHENEVKDYPYRLSFNHTSQISSVRYATGSHSMAFSAQNYMELEPLDDSLFSNFAQSDDFTIAFWLNPLRLGEGESIFSYRSPVEHSGQQMWQSIIAFIEMERVVWRFENIFFNELGEPILIELIGESIEKGVWSHHAVSFDSSRGFIQLLNDNNPVASRYTNGENHADKPVFPAFFQNNREKSIKIGEFFGYLDAFLISKNFMDRVALDAFNRHGYYISEPIRIADKVVHEITNSITHEKGSVSKVFARAGNSALILSKLDDDQDWREINNQFLSELDQKRYNFIQIRVDLYAGEGRRSSPILNDIKISYTDLPLPAKPGRLSAIKEGDNLRIFWQSIVARNVFGYKLYFGTESGEYIGVLSQGSSPIDVDLAQSISLYGLKPGTMYYFALVTYDEHGRESDFSPELVYLF